MNFFKSNLTVIFNLDLYLTFPKEPEFAASFYWVIWCNLHFCVLAKWAMAACQMWTTAVLVCCAFQRRYSCGNRTLQGRKEQNNTTEGSNFFLYREWSGFSLKYHSVVFGCWWTLWFKNKPSCGGQPSWRQTQEGRQSERKEDERKVGETTSQRR